MSPRSARAVAVGVAERESEAIRSVIPFDVLVNLVLTDAMRPPSYWERLRERDDNVASHDVQPKQWIGAWCPRCGAVNNRLGSQRCTAIPSSPSAVTVPEEA